MDVGECPGSRIILPQPFPASPDTSGFSGFVLGYSCGGSDGISPNFLHRPSESGNYWAIMARVSRGRSGTGAGTETGSETGQQICGTIRLASAGMCKNEHYIHHSNDSIKCKTLRTKNRLIGHFRTQPSRILLGRSLERLDCHSRADHRGPIAPRKNCWNHGPSVWFHYTTTRTWNFGRKRCCLLPRPPIYPGTTGPICI